AAILASEPPPISRLQPLTLAERARPAEGVELDPGRRLHPGGAGGGAVRARADRVGGHSARRGSGRAGGLTLRRRDPRAATGDPVDAASSRECDLQLLRRPAGPFAGWPPHRVRGEEPGREKSVVGPGPGGGGGPASSRDGGCDVSLLVRGQPVAGLLRGRQTEENRRFRWSAPGPLRCLRWSSWGWEPRR